MSDIDGEGGFSDYENDAGIIKPVIITFIHL